ncbi:MAG: AraC family transcriptional regulator [Rhodobacteraceae bacterium]|jgi:AraC family transcriptional regulator|nr:AraC family transcriptional regulator [Paracoccaceae bacterium]
MANDSERRILRVIDHIHDNPAGDLSLDALADVAAMSRFHWHRVFRALTGETVAQCVRRMRLHRAAIALVQGDDPLPKIALAVGYADVTTFTRAFSESYGTAPAAFRARGELRPTPRLNPMKGKLMYPVEIRTLPARTLVATEHQGPYHEINRAFERLFATLAARHLIGHTGHMVGVFLHDPSVTPPADLRSYAGAVVDTPFDIPAPLQGYALPAGDHAVLTYQGPYAGLPAAYDQLFGLWLPASGRQMADRPSFEVYLNSPMDTPQDQLLTELHLPLA